MLRGYSFRFRPRLIGRFGALAAAALACILFVSLGNWQSRRAAEKRDLALALDQAAKSPPTELPVEGKNLIHKHVAAGGRFVPERTVLLDNKLRRGRPGYEVVTPLRIGTSPLHVLVNRGWVAAPRTRDTLPDVRTPAGEVRVDGVALERIPHALAAGPSAGRVRQNLDIAEFAAESGLQLMPIVIEQHSHADDGLARDWPRADLGVEKHESYALQWYSLAALAIGIAVVLSFRRVAKA
jgi:surfeit locus 1 family protein